MQSRAYSVLDMKGIDSEKREIRGIATTPTPDRYGDIVDPLGVRFMNPMPLLHQHDQKLPVGSVEFGRATKEGVPFVASLPRIEEPGPLKDRVDTAWGEIKAGLVRAVSIGFNAIKHTTLKSGGIHFLESEVLELSLVTIPANADARIGSIKHFDLMAREAATGHPIPRPGVRLLPLTDASGSTPTTKTAPRPGVQLIKPEVLK
jgi:HK97 family phage prohead protease